VRAMEAHSPGSSLRDLVGPGYVGPIWCDGHEILRRIFVTVRDGRWREVAPTQWETSVDEASGSVVFNARHTSEGVDFEWRGELRLGENFRELRFAFEGRALRDMDVCRVGLVVLHPVESMVGSELLVNGTERVTVGRAIAPQPVADGMPQAMTEPFSALVIERPDFGWLELRFSGDLFELEDQRNWGDASFKTYCTPLRLGFPRALKAGTAIAHSVEARFEPAVSRPASSLAGFDAVAGLASAAAHWSATARTLSHPRYGGAFPALGREHDAASLLRNPGDLEPHWHHVHFDLSRDEHIAPLRAAFESIPSLTAELQLEVSTETPLPSGLVALISKHQERISRLLICGSGVSLPSTAAVERLRKAIDASGAPSLPLLATTRGYFVEFNRGRPLDACISGIAFPVTPTVHSDDVATIVDNVPMIADIAQTARDLTGLSQLAISPLSLYYPSAGPSPATSSNVPPALVRPWVAAMLCHASLAGITSVTLSASLLNALDVKRPDTQRFISCLLECVGHEVAPFDAPLSSGVHAIRFLARGHGTARAFVANLNPRSVKVESVEIPQFGTTWIDPEQ
jgi:D-apionolactonase